MSMSDAKYNNVSPAVKGVKSAERALALLDFIAERHQVRFQDVVDFGIPKSSAHGLLQTLTSKGWLDFSEQDRNYKLGLHVWEIGNAYDGHRGLIESADPVMDDLVTHTSETIQMARLEGIENVYIAIRTSPHPMRMASSVGMRLHAHATGIGKALLSTLAPEEAHKRLTSVVLPRLTPNTETDIDELMKILERVRDMGFAVDDEEFIEGCRCVAVPLTTIKETGIAAAISVTMPKIRTDNTWPHSLYPVLQSARLRIRESMDLPDGLHLS